MSPADAGPGIDVAMPGDGMPASDGTSAAMVRTRRIDLVDAQVAGGPHTDFPLLISMTENWLRSRAAGGAVESPAGFDIGFFADAAGATRLAHEIELYRGDVGALIAWVKVPSLSTASELFLRYGDPAITTSQENVAAVWSNGFAAVWHLHGDLADSTANANNGTNGGSTSAAGQIGDGRSFDGASGTIAIGSGASIDDVFTGGGTTEAWFRAADWGQATLGRIVDKTDWSLGVDDFNVQDSVLFSHGATALGGFWNTPANSVALNAWTHVAVVYDQGSVANTPALYLDGAPVTVTATQAPIGTLLSDAASDGRIGNRVAGDRTFNGRTDEIRLSRTARSPGWIATSFRNQADPAAFYTVGPEL